MIGGNFLEAKITKQMTRNQETPKHSRENLGARLDALAEIRAHPLGPAQLALRLV
jgi:hypothetical protein